MTIGIVGRKAGMTRIFTEDGASIPVSVIEVAPNRITQIKTDEVDGYQAIQITTGSRRASRVTKPMAGHYAKAGVEAGRGLWEFRVAAEHFRLACSKPVRKLMLPVAPSVKVSRAASSAITFRCRMLPTVTRCHIVPTVRLVKTRHRVA